MQGIGTDPPTTWEITPPPSTWTMPGVPFENVEPPVPVQFFYWSSTEDGTSSWVTKMNDGVSYTIEKDLDPGLAWPVRSAN